MLSGAYEVINLSAVCVLRLVGETSGRGKGCGSPQGLLQGLDVLRSLRGAPANWA